MPFLPSSLPPSSQRLPALPSPQHVRDAHERVVDGHAEVVHGHAVGAQHHEVAQRVGGPRHVAADQVVDLDLLALDTSTNNVPAMERVREGG